MARPKKKTVDYFPHSCTHGKTMFIIEQKYGNDGYAFWFKLLELLGDSPGHYIDLNDEAAQEFLQAKTRLGWDICKEILDLLAKLDAIDAELWEHNVVWSQNFVDGISDVYSNRRVETPSRPSFYIQKPCVADISTGKNPQTKLKETRVNKSTRTPQTPLQKNANLGVETDDDINDNSALKKIYDAFNANIHPITPFEAESLAGWLDDGMQPDAIIWAIRQAVLQGKRTAKYIDAIIRNLHAEGITTAAAAEARERNRANGKMQGPGRAREPTRLSPEEKERIAELNRQLAEALNMNRAIEEEATPWEQ